MATKPGFNHQFDVALFNADEQKAIHRFSKYFYITRATDPIQVGNSQYRAMLMRPAQEVSIALNVEREIIVLFADYENFEARTLKAFDKTLEQFDDVRVDKSVRFLVSRDDNVRNIIRHFLQSDPEYPIVIPFHYRHFLDPNEQFIFDNIRQNYFVRDLFGYQSPLRQEYFFFGRGQLVENVIDRHRSGQNSSLFGLRKSGKTSTIFAVQRRAKTNSCRTILIDCQDPAVHSRPYSALLEYIIVTARGELGLKKLPVSISGAPYEVSEQFRNYMQNLLSDSKTDLLIIFDEIENISPLTAASPHWRSGSDSLYLWQILRAFFQSQKKNKITFCFVGTNPHLFEVSRINDVDNPVYLFAPKNFIPMLSFSETKIMIERLGYFMGLDFDAQIISHIHKRLGGHPFFIRQLCSQIHRNTPLARPRSISLANCEQAERDVSGDIQNYLTEIITILRSFYPSEYDMLVYLARGDIDSFQEMLAYDVNLVEHLVGYGIVVRRNDDYDFAFDLVGEAVKRNISRSSETLPDRWSEISKRRNAVEMEIRSALFQWARQLDAASWSDYRSQCLTEKRRGELGALTPREAFSRNSSPLYFLELMHFVIASAGFHTGDGDQGRLKSAFDVVNRYRADAHAKTISSTDFAELISAVGFLEEVFVPPP